MKIILTKVIETEFNEKFLSTGRKFCRKVTLRCWALPGPGTASGAAGAPLSDPAKLSRPCRPWRWSSGGGRRASNRWPAGSGHRPRPTQPEKKNIFRGTVVSEPDLHGLDQHFQDVHFPLSSSVNEAHQYHKNFRNDWKLNWGCCVRSKYATSVLWSLSKLLQ